MSPTTNAGIARSAPGQERFAGQNVTVKLVITPLLVL